MEDNKSGDNGKQEQEQPQQPQFNCFVKIFFNTQTKDFAFETNVPDKITGYGMCELAKQGVDSHIFKAQQSKIVPAKGGIMNFARRFNK